MFLGVFKFCFNLILSFPQSFMKVKNNSRIRKDIIYILIDLEPTIRNGMFKEFVWCIKKLINDNLNVFT